MKGKHCFYPQILISIASPPLSSSEIYKVSNTDGQHGIPWRDPSLQDAGAGGRVTGVMRKGANWGERKFN